jgi:hypothetical protein
MISVSKALYDQHSSFCRARLIPVFPAGIPPDPAVDFLLQNIVTTGKTSCLKPFSPADAPCFHGLSAALFPRCLFCSWLPPDTWEPAGSRTRCRPGIQSEELLRASFIGSAQSAPSVFRSVEDGLLHALFRRRYKARRSSNQELLSVLYGLHDKG